MSILFASRLCGLAVAAIWAMTSIESSLAQAVATQFDLDGDGKNETIASSTIIQAGKLQNDFYDTVSVLNPHAFTGLTFDWELPGAQRFKGGLPVGAKWSDTNHYDSYITPFVFNYSINLTPTGCPVGVGCPAVTKTAEAWSPVNLYNTLKSIRDLFSVGESGTVEGDIDLGTGSPQLEVWATMTAEGDDLTLFQYYAENLTGSSVSLDWQFYAQNIDDPFRSLGAMIAPGATMLLSSVLSTGDPYETAGEVYATIGGQQIAFIATFALATPGALHNRATRSGAHRPWSHKRPSPYLRVQHTTLLRHRTGE